MSDKEFKLLLDYKIVAPVYKNLLHKIACKIFPWWFKPTYVFLSDAIGNTIDVVGGPVKVAGGYEYKLKIK